MKVPFWFTMACIFFPKLMLAQDSPVTLRLHGCAVSGDTISSFDNNLFQFEVDYSEFEQNDTLFLDLIHHREQGIRNSTSFAFTTSRDSVHITFYNSVKAGDGIVFRFGRKRGGADLLVKEFQIASTHHSLNKPYYFDVYFLYNEDTIATEKYILATRMKMEKHETFKRIFFNGPGEITRYFNVIYNDVNFDFQANDWPIYHGKITLFVLGTEALMEKHGFERSVYVEDIDHEGSGHRLMENVRRY